MGRGLRPVPAHPGAWRPVEYAGFWLRGFAFAIDLVIIAVAVSLVGVVTYGMLVVIGWIAGASEARISGAMMTAGQFVGAAVVLLYSAAFESSSAQATPGKQVIGAYVGDVNGEGVSFTQALMRGAARGFLCVLVALGFAVLGASRFPILHRVVPDLGVALAPVGALGFMLAGWTPHKQAFHDLLTGTYVFRR